MTCEGLWALGSGLWTWFLPSFVSHTHTYSQAHYKNTLPGRVSILTVVKTNKLTKMETFPVLGSICLFSSSSSFAQHAQPLSSWSLFPWSFIRLDLTYISSSVVPKLPGLLPCQPSYTHLVTSICLYAWDTVGAQWADGWIWNMRTQKALSYEDILSQEPWRRNGILWRPSGWRAP